MADAATVVLRCPNCEQATDTIRDGVCPECHYVLLGGDLAPDDLLAGTWGARLACE